MKKRIPSFLAGAASAALALALCTTALAASGQMSFNFAGVAVDGEGKIAAGETITAANGQRVPGSILYTDSAGGKTNYLPIRTISELLGVEVNYDAATRTILLGQQPETAAPAAKTGSHWKAVVEDGRLVYQCEEEGAKHDAPPAWRPAWLPEGWGLAEARGIGKGGSTASLHYYDGGSGNIHFQCSYPGKASFSYGSFADLEEALKTKRQVTVQGCTADLYTEQGRFGQRSLLAWENGEGLLFYLNGDNIAPEKLLQVAEHLTLSTGKGTAPEMKWLPKSSSRYEQTSLGDLAQEIQLVQGTSVTLLAAPTALAVQEEGPGEAVQVNGREARYWAAREPAAPREMETENLGGVTVTYGVISGFGAADMSTLLWSDPDTGMNFRLLSGLDKETTIRIAENVK